MKSLAVALAIVLAPLAANAQPTPPTDPYPETEPYPPTDEVAPDEPVAPAQPEPPTEPYPPQQPRETDPPVTSYPSPGYQPRGTPTNEQLWRAKKTKRVGPDRSGWFFGGSLGLGSLGFSDGFDSESYGALSYELHFGGMISRRWALMFQLWGASHQDNDSDLIGGEFSIDAVNVGVGARVWAAPKLWINGALGSARTEVSYLGNDGVVTEGVSVLGEIGYDLMTRRNLALDLSVRFVGTSYKDSDISSSSVTGQVGLSYF